MLIIELIFLAGLGIFGLKEPVKRKWRKEIAVYVIIFLMGSAILIMQTMHVKMPYLFDEVNKFFKYVLHLSYDK